MYTEINGSWKGIDKFEITLATTFFIIMLLGQRHLKKLEIRIKSDNTTQCQSTCTWTDTNYRPKEFVITIPSCYGKRRFLYALAHECVHIKQYVKNELKTFLRTHDLKWQGKLYRSDTYYWDAPWEIDAYGREQGLYLRFMEFYNILKRERINKKGRDFSHPFS